MGRVRKIKIILLSVMVASFIMISARGADATIIGGDIIYSGAGSGSFVNLTNALPAYVGFDTMQSSNFYGFDEGQNIFIGASILPDFGSTLLTGTEVASHFVFFDPEGYTRMIGYVDFDADILAVISSSFNLAVTHYLGDPAVNYINSGLLGLEDGDVVRITGSRIYVDFTAATPGDYIRVLTAHSVGGEHTPVPEPSTILLLGGGLLGAVFLRKKIKK